MKFKLATVYVDGPAEATYEYSGEVETYDLWVRVTSRNGGVILYPNHRVRSIVVQEEEVEG